MYCLNCGEKRQDNARYCKSCGQTVVTSAEEIPAVKSSGRVLKIVKTLSLIMILALVITALRLFWPSPQQSIAPAPLTEEEESISIFDALRIEEDKLKSQMPIRLTDGLLLVSVTAERPATLKYLYTIEEASENIDPDLVKELSITVLNDRCDRLKPGIDRGITYLFSYQDEALEPMVSTLVNSYSCLNHKAQGGP